MLKRRSELADRDLRAKLHAAYADPALQCPTPYLSESGEPFRLEVKRPHTRRHILERHGHEIADETGPNGEIVVKVPLGVHGADHLGIDPESGWIGCVLCEEAGNACV